MRFTPAGITRMFRAWPNLRAMVALFERDFYLHKYPDVAAAGVDPFLHYLQHGAQEGRKPHPLFDHDFYLLCCPEAREAAQPSILHFLKQAIPRGNPHPLFDCESYLDAHPEAARQRINPLVHYARNRPVEAETSHRITVPGNPSVPRRGPRADFSPPGALAPLSASEAEASRGLKPSVRLEIRDAAVTIVFGQPEPGSASKVVYVWEEAEGATRFLAPAEQQRFFQAMKYDQLRAQAR